MKHEYVAIDLDGCIAEFVGWKGPEHIGEPKDGVKEALEIISENFKIIVYSCRDRKDLIEQYMEEHDLPYDYINENPEQPETAGDDKVFAHHYIDDRAIEFDDNWEKIAFWFDFKDTETPTKRRED